MTALKAFTGEQTLLFYLINTQPKASLREGANICKLNWTETGTIICSILLHLPFHLIFNGTYALNPSSQNTLLEVSLTKNYFSQKME